MKATMQRRHFELIARTINSMRSNPQLRDSSDAEVDGIAQLFASELRYTNYDFQRDKFLKACGVTGES